MRNIDVNLALKLLKDDYILESTYENSKYIFSKINTSINIKSINFNINISYIDFLSLYKEYNFELIENKNNNQIDLEKDKEYYSKIQKHQ